MSELGEAWKTILARVGDFFDIFDLSFFVSGAVCLAALAAGNWIGGFFEIGLSDGYMVLGVAVACYVLGLVCFAGGRALRPRTPRFLVDFQAALARHGLAARYARYLDDPRDLDRLYNRMWAEARQSPSLTASFALLKRYWVMAATYDGLALAFFVWWLVLSYWWAGLGRVPPPHVGVRVAVTLALTLAVLGSRREAARLVRNQMEELVATIATVGQPAFGEERDPKIVELPK
jgi:hypothetical protein